MGLEEADNNPAGGIEEVAYPSIYFYNLIKHKVEWEILGAEVFICLNDQNDVLYLTNEAWTERGRDELGELDDLKADERYDKSKHMVN